MTFIVLSIGCWPFWRIEIGDLTKEKYTYLLTYLNFKIFKMKKEKPCYFDILARITNDIRKVGMVLGTGLSFTATGSLY